MKIVCRGVSNEKFALSCLFYGSVYRCETSLLQMNSTKFNEICDDILKSLQ